LHGIGRSTESKRPRESAIPRRRVSQARGLVACALSLCLFCIGAPSPAATQQADSPSEYQVKAAFLFNFAKFVEWPADAFAGPQAPFAICVLGQDPFGPLLDAALAGKTMGSHPVSLRRIKEHSEARRCHIVFVSASEVRNYLEVIDTVRGSSVLLVGDTDGFAALGGMIEFTLEGNHVRFLINPDAAQRAGLMLSSKLLMLARIVHDGAVAGKS
jgi:uncharacterized protein DUF4154